MANDDSNVVMSECVRDYPLTGDWLEGRNSQM